MREDPVPCRHATRYEREYLNHQTWNDDEICNPCKRYIAIWEERQVINAQEQDET